METTTLGRTGLTVSVAGLGCGGNSRLGLGRGATRAECMKLVHAALDLGVNLLDTAEAYGTEEIVGEALSTRDRSRIVVSSKSRYAIAGELLSPAQVVDNLEHSLKRLRTDVIDVFHVHTVRPQHYTYVMDEIVPALLAERDKGKLRFLGITETPPNDPDQTMMRRAVQDDVWDVVMVAFHMLHQGAREHVFPTTREKGIGTLIMFAVRNIFSRHDALRSAISDLAAAGQIPASYAASENPLGFLIREGGAHSLTDAAYRFARHEPGVDVVLFGTGSLDHLADNITSITGPPLPQDDLSRLKRDFGALTGVGLDLPDRVRPTS